MIRNILFKNSYEGKQYLHLKNGLNLSEAFRAEKSKWPYGMNTHELDLAVNIALWINWLIDLFFLGETCWEVEEESRPLCQRPAEMHEALPGDGWWASWELNCKDYIAVQ